jgi:endonuclease/exonuclease/phosphatase family metal-dependent hydrolase
MRSAFHAQRTADRRCPPHEGTRSFGDAVLSSGPVDGTEVHLLPNRPSGRERRSLVCLRTAHHGTRLLACGLHLVAL